MLFVRNKIFHPDFQPNTSAVDQVSNRHAQFQKEVGTANGIGAVYPQISNRPPVSHGNADQDTKH